MNTLEQRSTDKATIRMLTAAIVENIIHENAELDSEALLEIKEINKELTGNIPYAVLVDSRIGSTITKEGRELSASKEFQQQTIAKALLVRSLPHRMVGRFYIRVNKPHIKTKIFSDRGKALDWLKQQTN